MRNQIIYLKRIQIENVFKTCGRIVSPPICAKNINIQGADDKLGQFLDQDIETSANHRNVLRHSLESCPSLVSFNVNKASIFIKNMLA
jgi:hypothetical protein